jgi:putative phosphoesterase
VKLGLISDTHGFLDPRLPQIFRGVDHILHAGDIGPDRLLAQLETIAPVTAVLGNTDSSNWIALTETPTIGGRKFLIHHIVSPYALTAELEAQIARVQPQIVLFGHTHQRFEKMINDVLFINPGYSGQPKQGAERSVAVLHLEKTLRVEFISL